MRNKQEAATSASNQLIFNKIFDNDSPVSSIEQMLNTNSSLLNRQSYSFEETPIHAILFKMRALIWAGNIEKFNEFGQLLINIAKTYDLTETASKKHIGGDTMIHRALLYAQMSDDQTTTQIFVDIAKALLEAIKEPNVQLALLQQKNSLGQPVISQNASTLYFPQSTFVYDQMKSIKGILLSSPIIKEKKDEKSLTKNDAEILFDILLKYKNFLNDQPKFKIIFDWFEKKLRSGVMATDQLSAALGLVKIIIFDKDTQKDFIADLTFKLKIYMEDDFFNFYAHDLRLINQSEDIDKLINSKISEQTSLVFREMFMNVLSTIISQEKAVDAIYAWLEKNKIPTIESLKIIYCLIKKIDISFVDNEFEHLLENKTYIFKIQEIEAIEDVMHVENLITDCLARSSKISNISIHFKEDKKENIFITLGNLAQSMETLSQNPKKSKNLYALKKWFESKATSAPSDPKMRDIELSVAFSLLNKICLTRTVNIRASSFLNSTVEADSGIKEFLNQTKDSSFQTLKIDCPFSSTEIISITPENLGDLIRKKAEEYVQHNTKETEYSI